ncbi:hypothetical protein KC360_g5 [Hortaea werneckii]|nr:hypothetical protein KC344_g5 [Hortaea werneckii]KAI7180376.1 hypothetical protein KC360_g5 [Hortaea werneckii]
MIPIPMRKPTTTTKELQPLPRLAITLHPDEHLIRPGNPQPGEIRSLVVAQALHEPPERPRRRSVVAAERGEVGQLAGVDADGAGRQDPRPGEEGGRVDHVDPGPRFDAGAEEWWWRFLLVGPRGDRGIFGDNALDRVPVYLFVLLGSDSGSVRARASPGSSQVEVLLGLRSLPFRVVHLQVRAIAVLSIGHLEKVSQVH